MVFKGCLLCKANGRLEGLLGLVKPLPTIHPRQPEWTGILSSLEATCLNILILMKTEPILSGRVLVLP